MAHPQLILSCPRSTMSWRASVRVASDRPGRASTTCPSCGQGLRLLAQVGGRWAIVVTGPMAAMHVVLDRASTSGGLTTGTARA